MRKFILLISLLLMSTMIYAQSLFDGQWGMLYCDSNGVAEASFSLTLKQEGDVVTGRHIRVISYGDFIDEYEDSINGIAKDSVAIINIRTGRCLDITRAIGKAKLEIIKGDSIRFSLLKAPNWEHFFPDSAVLRNNRKGGS